MTDFAGVEADLECGFAVMAYSAELAVTNGVHGDMVSPDLHLEQCFVTDIALEIHAVFPMWKYCQRCR